MSNSASTIGLPMLRVSASAKSAALARMASAILNRNVPRSRAARRRQGPSSKAARAAPTARPTSSGVASGTRRITLASNGLMTSRMLSPFHDAHSAASELAEEWLRRNRPLRGKHAPRVERTRGQHLRDDRRRAAGVDIDPHPPPPHPPPLPIQAYL